MGVTVVVRNRVFSVTQSGARGESAIEMIRRLLVARGYDPTGKTDEQLIAAYFGLGYLPETTAWATAVIAANGTLSHARLDLVDKLIRRLQACGWWANAAVVAVVGEDLASSLVNLRHPETPMAQVIDSGGPLAFVADRYIGGTGHAYVSTGRTVADYAQNSAALFVRQADHIDDGQNRMLGSGDGKSFVVPSAHGALRLSVNAAAFVAGPGAYSSLGAFGAIRRAADAIIPVIAGDEVDAIASASVAPTGGAGFRLLAAGGQRGTGKGVWWAFGRATADAVQTRAVFDALDAHAKAIGALL